MGNLRVWVSRVTRTSKRFYPLLGPFLSRREVVRELGGPVWDEEGKQWFVAQSQGRVVGFVGLLRTPETAKIVSLYVAPEARGRGVCDALLKELLGSFGDHVAVSTVATPSSVSTFKRHGLRATGKRGRFTIMEKS